MKKHLIAAAVAGALAVPAMAQVTLSGNLEVNALSTTQSGATSTTKLASGTINTSRLTFSGSEDLGGGLKAGFFAEARLDSVYGDVDEKSKASFFERGAGVSLSGAFGTVRLGKLDLQGGENNDQSFFGNIGLIDSDTEIGSDQDGSIDYTTPAFGGFTFNIGHAMPDNASTSLGNLNSHDGITTYQLKGTVSGITLIIGAGEEKETTGLKEKVMGYSIGTTVAGVKASLGYQKSDQPTGTNDITHTVVNLAMPLGAATGHLVYGKMDVSNVTATDETTIALGASYALSKRTGLHAMYRTVDFGSGGSATTKETLVGINHKF